MRKMVVDVLIAFGFFALILQAYTEMQAEQRFHRGDDFLRAGQFDLAVVSYRDALEITPDRYEILRALGSASIQSYEKGSRNLRPLFIAESALNAATEANPIYPYGWHELGEVTYRLQEAGAPNAAKPDKFFRRALEIDPENPRFLAALMLRQLDAGLRVEAWNTFKLLIDSDPAAILVYGGRIIENDGDVTHLLREIKGDWSEKVYLARLVYRQEDFHRAEELLRSLPADRQTQPEIASLLANSLRRQDRLPEAEKALRLALAKNPKNPFLTGDLGRLLAAAKKKREAMDVFSQVVSLKPATPTELFLCLQAAKTAQQLQEWDLAAKWYEAALGVDLLNEAETRDALVNFGEVRRQQGRPRLALIVYEQLLELEPENPKFKEMVNRLQLEIERQEHSAD